VTAQTKPAAGAGPDENPLLYRTERENEALARSFCAAWSAMSPERICAHLAEDVVYMVYEGGPVKRGIPEIHATLTAFMQRWRSIDFRIFRMHAIGSVVIHERTEIYTGRDGHPDWEFNVTGLLHIKDGKIKTWRDYSLPGARQIFTSA
jgi:limonene-1,2-epoxide hydrolase